MTSSEASIRKAIQFVPGGRPVIHASAPADAMAEITPRITSSSPEDAETFLQDDEEVSLILNRLNHAQNGMRIRTVVSTDVQQQAPHSNARRRRLWMSGRASGTPRHQQPAPAFYRKGIEVCAGRQSCFPPSHRLHTRTQISSQSRSEDDVIAGNRSMTSSSFYRKPLKSVPGL